MHQALYNGMNQGYSATALECDGAIFRGDSGEASLADFSKRNDRRIVASEDKAVA